MVSRGRSRGEGVEKNEVIDAHLDGYNTKDYEKFRACFHEEIEAYQYPGKLWFKGKEELDKRYKEFVTDFDKFAAIPKRIVDGPFVIDREVVTMGDKTINAFAIYEIKDSLIYRMTLIQF